jgi:hypothetical protein
MVLMALKQGGATVLAEPSFGSPVIAQLSDGARFHMEEGAAKRPDAWWRVVVQGGREGWIPSGTRVGLASLEPAEPGDAFAPEKAGIAKGVVGGLVMMGIAVVWFVLGWMAGYIFYYPPILFLIGVYACIKGAVTGNVSGR